MNLESWMWKVMVELDEELTEGDVIYEAVLTQSWILNLESWMWKVMWSMRLSVMWKSPRVLSLQKVSLPIHMKSWILNLESWILNHQGEEEVIKDESRSWVREQQDPFTWNLESWILNLEMNQGLGPGSNRKRETRKHLSKKSTGTGSIHIRSWILNLESWILNLEF